MRSLAIEQRSLSSARSGYRFDVDHDQTRVGHPHRERGHAATVGQRRPGAQVEFPTVGATPRRSCPRRIIIHTIIFAGFLTAIDALNLLQVGLAERDAGPANT